MDKLEKLNNFLEEFNHPWRSIKDPKKRLEHYFCIEEGGVIGLKLYGDNCLYLGSVDVAPGDVQSLANSIKVLVRNHLTNEEKK